VSNAAQRLGVPPRLIGGVISGTLLNPLNSSMIAVALVEFQREFDVGVATSTWLISAFYLTAAVGQPLMGRLVDLFGARRIFIGGLALTLIVCAVAPFAPGFWWLVAVRAIQGIGTSAAYPAALVVFRSASGSSPPSGAIAIVGIVAGGSAALGPVVGGVLIALVGWEAIFWINIPIAIFGMANAYRTLPPDQSDRSRTGRKVVHDLDLPGIALFSTTIALLVIFLLSLATEPQLPLVPVLLVCGAALVAREWTATSPFLDIRGIVANRALASLLLQQGGVNLVFYLIFFGLPMWLQSVREISVGKVGLLMLPLAAVSLVAMPVTARALRTRGLRPVLVFGSATIVIATLAMQWLDAATSIAFIVVIVTVLGIPSGLNNLALQSGLFTTSPSERMGSSSGLFQTFRYLGAILASSTLGVMLEGNLTSGGLHDIGWVATGTAVLLILLALALPKAAPRALKPESQDHVESS
jgi:MFS family permease